MRKPDSFVSITVFSISGNLILRSDIGRIVYSRIEMLAAANSNHHKQKVMLLLFALRMILYFH